MLFFLKDAVFICEGCWNKAPRPGGFSHRRLPSHSPGAWESQIKARAGLAPAEGALSLAQSWSPSPSVSRDLPSVCFWVLIPASKAISHIGLRLTLKTPFYLNHLLKGPISQSIFHSEVPGGLRASTRGLEGPGSAYNSCQPERMRLVLPRGRPNTSQGQAVWGGLLWPHRLLSPQPELCRGLRPAPPCVERPGHVGLGSSHQLQYILLPSRPLIPTGDVRSWPRPVLIGASCSTCVTYTTNRTGQMIPGYLDILALLCPATVPKPEL